MMITETTALYPVYWSRWQGCLSRSSELKLLCERRRREWWRVSLSFLRRWPAQECQQEYCTQNVTTATISTHKLVLTLSSAVVIKGSYRSTIYKSECLLVYKCLHEAPTYRTNISASPITNAWQSASTLLQNMVKEALHVSGPTPWNTA